MSNSEIINYEPDWSYPTDEIDDWLAQDDPEIKFNKNAVQFC